MWTLRWKTRECTTTFAEKGIREYTSTTKCCNCGKKGHAAGDRNCAEYLKEVGKQEKKVENNNSGKGNLGKGVNKENFSEIKSVPTYADFDVGKKGTRGAPVPLTKVQTNQRTSI